MGPRAELLRGHLKACPFSFIPLNGVAREGGGKTLVLEYLINTTWLSIANSFPLAFAEVAMHRGYVWQASNPQV